MYGGIRLPAYGNVGACIGNVSDTNLHIKLDTYNTAYASCDTWTLYIIIFFDFEAEY